MIRFGLCVAAALIGAGVMATEAKAGPAAPSTAAAGAAVGAPVETVAWVCGPRRCVWQPGARVWVPPYARRWGPPRRPGCYWAQVRRPNGSWRWIQICR